MLADATGEVKFWGPSLTLRPITFVTVCLASLFCIDELRCSPRQSEADHALVCLDLILAARDKFQFPLGFRARLD
jgi:hypothetical protein